MSGIGEYLKKRLPEFQQGASMLDGYLEASGEFLDSTKSAIVNLDNVHDYKNSTEFFVENTLMDRWGTVSSRIALDHKRRILRDISEINRRNGTLEGIIHAIRMAGLTPDIRVGWVPSPRNIAKGYRTDPVSQVTTSYDISRYVYTHLLYGEPVVEEDGVFFYGYRYYDIDKQQRIGPLPIIGERYEKAPANKTAVQSTPYIVVRFDEAEKTIVTEEVIDPVTGEVYKYSTSEEFALINEVLKFALVETNRPTTLRVVVIASLQPFEEVLRIDQESTDDHTYVPDGGDHLTEQLTVGDEFQYEASLQIGDTEIGIEKLLIGIPAPYQYRYSGIVLNVGDSDITTDDIYEWDRAVVKTYHKQGDDQFLIPLRGACHLWAKAPSTTPFEIYGMITESDITPTLVATVAADGVVFLDVTPEYGFYKFVYEGDVLHSDLKIGIIYREQPLQFTNIDEIVTEIGDFIEDEFGSPLS